ncbi:BamA/TamA family outer membrane protein, partial [Calditrichota bacterium]
TDFDMWLEIIAIGRKAARDKLPEIRNIVGDHVEVQDSSIYLRDIILGAFPSFKRENVFKISGLKKGFQTTQQINAGLLKLLHFIHTQGYGASKIKSVSIEDDVLLVAIDPGVVREIRVEGVPSIRQGMVMREVRVIIGQPFRNDELFQTLTQLHATGRYTVAYSYFEPHIDGGVILVFLLEEAPFPILGIGMGFDSERQARYFAQMSMKSGFLREGEEITVSGKYGIRDSEYGINIRADRLAQTYLGWRLESKYSTREQDMFYRDEVVRVAEVFDVNTEFSALFNLYTWGELSAGIKSEWVKSNNSDIFFKDFINMTLNGIVLKAMLDTEDKKPFPNSGTRFGIEYESYIDYLLSDRAFNKAGFEAEVVQTIFPRNVARLAWRSGVADLTTPRTHQYRLGGINDFPSLVPDRFMALRRISGTFEWRYDMISRYVADAYFLARYDLAAFSDDEDWRPKREDMIHSFSLGFALDTFLGPMEIWYAYSPPSRSLQESDRFMLNLGYRF